MHTNVRVDIDKMKTKWDEQFFSKKISDYSSVEFLILSRMVVFLTL